MANDDNNQSDDEIVIDLTKPLFNQKVASSALLQYEAKAKLTRLLTDFKDDLKNEVSATHNDRWLSSFETRRANNTIYISGHRGSGKTTFLQTVLAEQLSNKTDRVMPIALIDPTLVETHQHILVDIIARIKQLFESQLSCCGRTEESRRFTQALDSMAEGLQLLNDANGADTKDATWFLNKALKNSVGGQTLEAKFHHLIDVVAELLNQELFVIAIDDVDTDTSKAYFVLEMIRCYLTHPKLVVLVTGDPMLYSLIVKGHKIKELGFASGSKMASDDYVDSSIQQIEHLEQQYLAKVLPVEQRIELKGLYDLVNGEKTIRVVTAKGSRCTLKEKLQSILVDGLNLKERYIDDYLNFILTQPIRTIFQIIKYTTESERTTKTESVGINGLAYALKHSYIGAFYKQNINLEKFSGERIDANTIGIAQFVLCQKFQELETGHYGRPDSNNEDYNAVQFFLASVATNYFANKEGETITKAFRLMLATGASMTTYKKNVSLVAGNKTAVEDYCYYIGLSRKQDSVTLAAHLSSFFVMPLTHKIHYCGVVRFKRNIPKEKQTEYNNLLKNLEAKPEENKGLVKLDYYKNKKANLGLAMKGIDFRFRLFLSYRLLALAGHTILIGEERRDFVSCLSLVASLAELYDASDVENIYFRLSTIKAQSFPAFIANGDGGESSEHLDLPDDVIFNHDSAFHQHVIALLKAWRKDNGRQTLSIGGPAHPVKLSTLLIGKIWNRIDRSLDNISDKVKLSSSEDNSELQNGLANILAKYIWSMINAVLIEEVRYGNERNDELHKDFQTAKNVVNSPAELCKHLLFVINRLANRKNGNAGNFNNVKKHLPLTYWLISCPILWPYLAIKYNSNDTTVLSLVSQLINTNAYLTDDGKTKNTVSSYFCDGLDKCNFIGEYKIISELAVLKIYD